MRTFAYTRAASAAEAASLLRANVGEPIALLAGGTCLLDLMKQDVERPSQLIDLNFAGDLAAVAVDPDGSLRVGATATLARVARRTEVRAGWPLLVETILKGLTPQLREAATFGGNITQRPRCIYFREPDFACNKRVPGSGCAARSGVHFGHAILGGAAAADCIAVHPSDLATALTVLGAEVEIVGPDGPRTLPITRFHRLPGDDPTRETTLEAGELITAVRVPPETGWAGAYVKGPEEGFALASAAVLLRLGRDGTIAEVRIVLGGLAHKPWPSPAAEAALIGRLPEAAAFARASQAALADAETDGQTEFRRALVGGVLAEALERAARRAAARPDAVAEEAHR